MNRVILVVVALLAAVLVGAYFYFYPTYTYRYRLTLEVELPDGAVRSSSSVVEVEKRAYPDLLWVSSGITTRVTGEAAAVDLGGGRLLVALLTRRTRRDDAPGGPTRGWAEKEPTQLLARAYGEQNEWLGRGRNPGLGRIARRRGAREIGPGDLPDLVTFGDASDPRTVREVSPRDLAASFGPGVRLRRAAIEVTGDPVTEGVIERRLPWLRQIAERGGALDGSQVSNSNALSNSLGAAAFKRRRV